MPPVPAVAALIFLGVMAWRSHRATSCLFCITSVTSIKVMARARNFIRKLYSPPGMPVNRPASSIK